MSRPCRKPIQPPIQWILGVISPRVRWLRLEVDSSPQLVPRSRISGAIPLLPL